MQKTRVQSLGREDPLKKEMAPRSSTLAWKIPWTEEPGWLEYMGCKELDMTEQLIHAHGLYGLREWLKGKESVCNAGDTGDMCSIPGFRSSPGVGHGNPLWYSCLENPMDREAW